MPKLIALDDGHGMETAGKRTPPFPDGRVMHENEFNRRVVQLLTVHLTRCGFKVLQVAPTDVDTPLKTRTDMANKAKADLYVSVHANAVGTGWSSARGIETFHYPGSESSKRAAEILHRHLLTGTALQNRGVKTADLHVLRETNMPAVLVECGFMTNLEEAKLLLSEQYRVECAEELARGICEYFGSSFVRETAASADDAVKVIVRGNAVADGKLIGGTTYVPLRAVAEGLGAKVGWDNKTKTATVD